MFVFQWDKNFETGLIKGDKQHRHLVKLVNEFGSLLSQDRVSFGDREKLCNELVSYTQYHFKDEEKLMTLVGVDERHVSHHKQEHQNFLQDVTLMYQEMILGQNDTDKILFDFLVNWLIYHILGSDMNMAKQIEAINAGSSAADSFMAKERNVDKATGLLLKALNNLFHQVSNRNKQLNELNQTLEAKVEERTQSLSEANLQLEELALTDVLTGLSNRRHALQMLEQLWDESIRNKTSLACMMIDADGFKKVNDTYGHDAGDIVLCELAKHLRYSVRTDDIVCRLGGDEFLIICPNTNEGGAMHIANLTHAEIAALTVRVAGGVWQGSISVGVAVQSDSMQSPADLIRAADRGVYAAKGAGKNCVKMVK